MPDEPLLILSSDFTPIIAAIDDVLVKSLYRLLVFVKVSSLQTIFLNVGHDRNKQVLKGAYKTFKFRVKRALPQIVIQISDQVDQAFLLPTRT